MRNENRYDREISKKSRAQQARRRKRRKRSQANARRMIILTAVLLVLACALMILAPKRSHAPIINAMAQHPETTGIEAEDTTIKLEPDPTIASTPDAGGIEVFEIAPETEATPPAGESSAQTLGSAPEAPVVTAADVLRDSFNYLPVYRQADITEKKIAVTVDDCFQVENLRTIVNTAQSSGAKLTIFPIGKNLSRPGVSEALKDCVFKLGFEIENHTWSHQRVFRMPETEMAEEIWKQGEALNKALGANYEQHFFRLMGGDGSSDQRTHNYLSQLGFKGIAEWSVSGSDSDITAIKDKLAPGAIYLFHTTNGDTRKLQEFIPYAVSQGYALVTLNELLGYSDNAITAYKAREMPIPRGYTESYRAHKQGDYAWNIVCMQDELRKMGYLQLEGPSTGFYGAQTAEAVAAFQSACGLPATGIADSDTQRRLLAS